MTSQPVTTKLTQPVTSEPVTTTAKQLPTQPAVTGRTPPSDPSTTTAAAPSLQTRKRNLCPCSEQARASQLSVESQATPLSNRDAQRQIVEESIREEVRNTLSVDTTSLSSNRRSKLSEGDLTIAYGVGLAGTVLVIAQLLWSAYQVRKYGIKGKQDENLSKKGERPREGEGNKTRQRKHENDPPAERT
ncbi:hypothetical protein ACOMHN_014269 [Nucella lapillus]